MKSQPTQFQRESDHLRLHNAHISLRFSLHPPGSLISLATLRSTSQSEIEVINPTSALAGAETWRVEFPGSSLPAVSSRQAERFLHHFSPQEDGAGRLDMEWRVSGPLPLRVWLTLTLPADSSLCYGRGRVQLPSGMPPGGVDFLFPRFSGFPAARLQQAALFLPVGEGLLFPEPHANLAATTDWLYPGDLTMQFAGLQFASSQACLYVAAQDAAGRLKGLRAGPDELGGFSLSFLNFLSPDPQGSAEIGYELAFGLLPGDWVEAARAYRRWTPFQPPRRDRTFALWLVQRGDGHQVASAARAMQRETNTPVRLLWQWWHGCPGDSRYPDYLPPREGESAFSSTLSVLKEAGIPVWLGLDAALASPRSRTWGASHLEAHVSLDPGREPREIKENPFADDSLTAMCPAEGAWPSLLNDLSRQIKEVGAQGLWLTRLTPTGAGLRCFSDRHGHPPGAGDYLPSALAGLCDGAIASAPAETFLQRLEAAVFSGSCRERQGRPAGWRSDDWQPIPLLQAVYSPNLNSLGLIGPLSNLFPHDPLWPLPSPPPRRTEVALLRGDYSLQFCLEAARTLLWGCQPALLDFDPNWARDQASLKNIAFLQSLFQVNAAEPARGEFLGEVPCESETVEVDFLVNSLYSLPGQRRVFSRTLPAVQATVWRRDGAVALICVNLLEKEAQFSCRLPLSRLGIRAPTKVYCLTFSREFGGQTAHLSLAGGEISGRLPGRSASIIRL